MGPYKWKKTEKGLLLERWEGKGSCLKVPEMVDGVPVAGLGEYSIRDHRELEEVWLPDRLQILGAHCFYDCRNLHTIHLSDHIVETADGSFKNCRSLRFIELKMLDDKMTVLKSILEECSQKITVSLQQDEEEARLLFPVYLHDYEENTQARIINQITYGAGVHYRQCVMEKGIDYRNYDSRFALLAVIEQEQIAGETALLRLSYPVCLGEPYRKQYEDFLREHFLLLGTAWIKEEREELLFLLLDCRIQEDDTEKLLLLAQQQGAVSMISRLLDYKRTYRKEEDTDEFAL